LGSIIAPLVIGPILDHVNLNPVTLDCLTGLDITPDDYRIVFAISDAVMICMALHLFFFVNVEVEKSEKKSSFKQEFGWVS
jgi:hypothetical protein